MELDQLWLKTCAVFRSDISVDVYDLWISQLEPVGVTNDEFYLSGPERARSWIDLRYRRVLSECASRVAGRDVRAVLIDKASVPVELFATNSAQAAIKRAGMGGGFHTETGLALTAEQRVSTTPLNPRYTFDQFVIGRTNQIGHAAALAVAEQPAQAFNPLFIYGAPGVGKTHLLHAIGNYLQQQAPELAARYMTAEDFATVFRAVLRDNSIGQFKDDLRSTDVLLIDDVQFLQNKAKTEEEFFHTFNALQESGRQLVITCDRTPRELEALADRLRERFESGLVVEIEQPNERLRTAILRKRARVDNIPIEDEAALTRIAERVPANVRSLEGALIRVSAFASMQRTAITPELVDQLLDSLHPRTAPRVSILQVQKAVSDYYGLSIEELLCASRERRVSAPRQLAMYLSCELTNESLPMIAAAFDRDHSTVIHARDKTSKACGDDSELASVADRLRRVLNSDISDRASA